MPNTGNVTSPALIIGAGRTSSSYVISHLRYSAKTFQEIIENDVYRALYENCSKSWWSKDWHWMVQSESEARVRIYAAIRATLVELFPSEDARWAMKMLWAGHEPEVVDGIFPAAKYLHLVRDPRANIPSIEERIGWSRAEAEASYVKSNEGALAFGRFEGRYLRIRQEEFEEDRKATWCRICQFLETPYVEDSDWASAVNVAKSQVGKADHTRSDTRVAWDSLTVPVQEMATLLGYQP